MRGKKLLIAKTLHGMGFLNLFLSKKNLYVFCYHRIAKNTETINQCIFDSYVYGGCTRKKFISQLNWLKNNTNILSLDNLLHHCEGDHECKGPYGMVTFDDAYSDCYTEAYPILKQMGIPATVFVPSKLVDDGQLGWWDIIAYIIKNTQLEEINWENKTFYPSKEFDYTFRYFLNKMKLEPFESNVYLINKLASICQVEIPDAEMQASNLMSWQQLKEMSEDVFEIGSHTHTHRVLTTLSESEQYEEICLSKRIIEKKIGKQVKSLAYPVGGVKHYDSNTQQAAKDCGYQAVFSFNNDCNSNINKLDLFDVSRFEPALDPALLAGQCALPRLLL